MRRQIRKLKGIMSLSLIVFVVVALLGVSLIADAKKKSSSATYAEGDNIAFGSIDGNIINWTILSYDENTGVAFVVSRKTLNSYSISDYRSSVNMQIIQQQGGNTGYVPWANNYWRGWLNQVFYVTAFNDAERAMIKPTELTAAASQTSLMNFYKDTTLDDFYVKTGDKNSLNLSIYNNQVTTTDYIFFLSTDEYTAHKDSMKYETSGTWPLRTNSFDDPVFGLFVNDTSKLIEKWGYYNGTGIRPAMYIQLTAPKPAEETAASGNKSATTADANAQTGNNQSQNNQSQNANANANKTDANASNANNTKANDANANNANANNNANNSASNASGSANQQSTSKPSATNSRKYANNGTNIGNITLPDDASYSLSAGSTAQVALNMEYLNSTDKQYTITYTSSDGSIFTVDSNGLITGVSKGTGTLSVRMKKSNGKVYSMTCRIDVT
ncbi:MAG: Ig-like domain-containing protein [Pseudobutyrivibrio sp.]|nr:Ig-like domain-containing protein [Pseudobutyrivibrio sp.]